MKNNKLFVLLGSDFSGKTTLLNKIKLSGNPIVCGGPEEILASDSTGTLMHLMGLFNKHVQNADSSFSQDFILTSFQMYLVGMKNWIEQQPRGSCVLIDSYFYKVLAKCRIKNWKEDHIFEYWRSFEKPETVFWLNTPVTILWQRVSQQKSINKLESFSYNTKNEQAFQSFQELLRQKIKEEVTGIPLVEVIHGQSLDEQVQFISKYILQYAV